MGIVECERRELKIKAIFYIRDSIPKDNAVIQISGC